MVKACHPLSVICHHHQCLFSIIFTYQTVQRNDESIPELQAESLDVSDPLSTLACGLRGSISIPANPDTTNQRTCEEMRIATGVSNYHEYNNFSKLA